MTAQKWVRSSLRTLSAKLEAAGHAISPPTVGRLLRKLDYSLHVNSKKIEASSKHPDRDQQFDYIAVQQATFRAAGLPILSTDAKKKRACRQLQERRPGVDSRADRSQRARLPRRRGRTGRAVRRVRHHDQSWLHLSRHLGRYAGVRRRDHLCLVADRRRGEVPRIWSPSAAGRRRWQQWMSHTSMERAAASPHLRSPGLDGDRLPLSNRM
jgi:Rhodopirellula transposase DDE domain